MPTKLLKVTFYLALVFMLSACRSDTSTHRATFQTENLPALTTAPPIVEEPSCDRAPWVDSKRLELFPTWCGVPDSTMQTRRNRATIEALISAKGWSTENDGKRVILTEPDVRSITCDDLEDMIEAAGHCLLKPPYILFDAMPRCVRGGLSFDPKQQGRPTELGCMLTPEDCEARPECASRGECVPGFKAGALTCVGTKESCPLLPECSEYGCTFEGNTCIPISQACGLVGNAMANGAGINGLFDAIDPKQALPLQELVERATEALEACPSSPHRITAPQIVPTEAPLEAVLIRIHCEKKEKSIIPCDDRFGLQWSSYSALAWRTETAQGTEPIAPINVNVAQSPRGWGAPMPSLRKVPNNQLGWTHEFRFTQIISATFAQGDENGATCCHYNIDVTESVSSFVRIDDRVTVELPYAYRVIHGPPDDDPSAKASETCKASVKWKNGVPTIRSNNYYARKVRLAPDIVQGMRETNKYYLPVGCTLTR